jgi:hypothetical protein
MSYTDLYLKFKDEAEMRSVLFEKVPTAWDNTDPEPDGERIPVEWEDQQLFRNTDIIGVIYEGGSWDEGGNEVEAPVALEGFHCNVRALPGESVDALELYKIETPNSPERVWA